MRIGKEARNLDISQVMGDTSDHSLVYDEGWPYLKERLLRFTKLQIHRASGLARSDIYRLLGGDRLPEPKTYRLLTQTVEQLEKGVSEGLAGPNQAAGHGECREGGGPAARPQGPLGGR